MRTPAARNPGSFPTAAALLGVVAALLILAPACDKATPVAPSGSTILLSANPTRIEVDGAAEITAIAFKEDGTPVNEGTEIFFSTTLGTIDEMVPTDDRGRAVATLRADGRVGTATVTATSGGVEATGLDINIGSTANSLTLQANPTRVPKTGGTVSLVATVRDEENNPLPGLAVTFRTEAGVLDSGGGTVETNSRGEARDRVTVQEFDLAGLSEFFVFAETTGTATGEGGDEGGVGDLLTAQEIIDVAGFAATIILTPTPRTLPETGGEVSLQAVVLDDIGEPSVDAAVIFGSEIGSLESGGRPVFTDSEGLAEDTLDVTAEDLAAQPGSDFDVTAETPGAAGETIQDLEEVLILRGEIALLISADRESVTHAADSQVRITATVVNQLAEGVSGALVTFTKSVTYGTLSPEVLVTESDGKAITTLEIKAAEWPASPTSGVITVTCRAEFRESSVSGSISIRFEP